MYKIKKLRKKLRKIHNKNNSDALVSQDLVDLSNKEISPEILQEDYIGDFFKNARESANIDISEVANYLRVRINDIKTLENNDIEKIAKNIYAPGLIKSYGKFLKIDPKIIEEKLQNLTLRSNIDIKKHTLININEEKKPYPSKDIFINSSIIFTILFIVFLFLFSLIENNSNSINTDLITNDILKTNY